MGLSSVPYTLLTLESVGWGALAVAVNAGIGILALRGLWKAQHRLDARGHLIRWGVVVFGGVIYPLVYRNFLYGSVANAVLFGAGMLAILLFLFPDIAYYVLKWHDRRKVRRLSENQSGD